MCSYLSLKQYLESESVQVTESFAAKGVAIGQNRQHAANRNKLLSSASRLRDLSRRGMSEDNVDKRYQILFALFSELATALTIQATMAKNEINVSTAGVLDMESIKGEITRTLARNPRRNR